MSLEMAIVCLVIFGIVLFLAASKAVYNVAHETGFQAGRKAERAKHPKAIESEDLPTMYAVVSGKGWEGSQSFTSQLHRARALAKQEYLRGNYTRLVEYIPVKDVEFK